MIWAIDALQPEGHGTLLYVLYEVLSGTSVSAIQLPQAQAQDLIEWLQPYQELPYKALATLSDGESAIISAMNSNWTDAPHQRRLFLVPFGFKPLNIRSRLFVRSQNSFCLLTKSLSSIR
ncbi:hypothetical protein [Nostoc sp.]|uniref:hypothetical protein n=1 Tax=Nostoc sp. TaxID=1180 RepID=UPI002FFD3A56